MNGVSARKAQAVLGKVRTAQKTFKWIRQRRSHGHLILQGINPATLGLLCASMVATFSKG